MNLIQIHFRNDQCNAVSRILTADISARSKALHVGARLVVRDLGIDPIAHLHHSRVTEALAGDKTVIITSSRGDVYSGESPLSALDHQEAYLEAVFRFLGINRISFARAEGVNVRPEQRDQAIVAARGEIASMAA